ncbi:HAD hydrolase family protein [Winogradskyella schleiferi]|uniref:HAD hydrolase family protein n=1 Tax=Winogradskyella schleiferi TaxID=2686078 RepID=UPI003744A439
MCSFGDAENDLNLFEVANTPIAMKNAQPKLISKSDYANTRNYYEGVEGRSELFLSKNPISELSLLPLCT